MVARECGGRGAGGAGTALRVSTAGTRAGSARVVRHPQIELTRLRPGFSSYEGGLVHDGHLGQQVSVRALALPLHLTPHA